MFLQRLFSSDPLCIVTFRMIWSIRIVSTWFEYYVRIRIFDYSPSDDNDTAIQNERTLSRWLISVAGIDFRTSTDLGKRVNPLRASVTLWARAMDSMLRASPNATLKPHNIECKAPLQTKWNDGQRLLRFSISSHVLLYCMIVKML